MNSKLNFDNLSRKVEELKQLCYQHFAPRITNIENYLSTLTERVQDDSVIVTSNLQTEQITPLDISESELVQVYNDVPKVLLKNSIIAELTTKSYREDRNNEPIFLENDENGKYWIIVSNQNNIFLVPSINIKLHIHKLKTVEKLFDFHGDTSLLDTHFMLTKPAKVSGLPNGKKWKLEEKGILEFSVPFSKFKFEVPDFPEPKEDPHLEIQRINQTLDNLKLQFEQSQKEKINLESQIINISDIKDNQANINLEILKINKQINSFKLQLEEFQKEKTNLELQIRNIPKIRDNQAKSNLEIPEINQQLDDLRLELNRSHELRKSLESCIVEMSKELDDLKLQLSHSQEKQKELESRLEKMPFLRDYAYQQDLQIDLLKVRIESLENR
jgi:DNA repair exonuclease SbcCD ATPase subunit